MGRDVARWGSTAVGIVSTHAPAWGATCMKIAMLIYVIVSTHAPAWGATVVMTAIDPYLSVSTHAPAWGATSRLFDR